MISAWTGAAVGRADRAIRPGGPQGALTQPNSRYRAVSTTNPAEQRAIAESFATSTLWGFKVEAESDGRVQDATDFRVERAWRHRRRSGRQGVTG